MFAHQCLSESGVAALQRLDNVDVIEMIHNKFKTKREEGTIRDDEVKVPLVMLLPDKDGKTALDLSMDN